MMRLKYVPVITVAAIGAVLLLPAYASAHVVVTPSQTTVGAYERFTVSVPNERDVAVTELKLTMPAQLDNVQPTIQSGWTVHTDTTQNKAVTAIIWNKGSVPAGQRAEFSFAAQAPVEPTQLTWKAFQTYADGTVVSWDQTPQADAQSDDDSAISGPYSVTRVKAASAANSEASDHHTDAAAQSNTLPLAISLIAVLLSVIALLRSLKTSSDHSSSADQTKDRS